MADVFARAGAESGSIDVRSRAIGPIIAAGGEADEVGSPRLLGQTDERNDL